MPAKGIVVVALLDVFNNVRLFSVTALRDDLRLTYPPQDSGTYSGGFQTGRTTLGELADRCLDAHNGFGAGASWGYIAIACAGYGYTNFDVNIVAINFHGANVLQPAIDRLDIGDQLQTKRLDQEVRALTFNTFAWTEDNFLGGATPDAVDTFHQFVQEVEVGRWRGEPIKSAGG
ncbi:MAG TPA: hypothetical protein VGR26_10685 [Acidimicrobiales bacterium]|nr:hypothetical protein [Acidimicrobiales bacterium]